jgi:hypothetical protein
MLTFDIEWRCYFRVTKPAELLQGTLDLLIIMGAAWVLPSQQWER